LASVTVWRRFTPFTDQDKGGKPLSAQGSEPPDRDELLDCLLRASAENQAAFAEFVNRISPRLIGFLSMLAHAWGLVVQDVEDAAQETLLRVSQARFEPGRGSAWGWISIIARRELCNIARRHHPTISLDAPWLDQGDQGMDPADPRSGEEKNSLEVEEEFQQLWDQLTDEERDLLWRKYAEGQTAQTIATSLGLTVKTVYMRLHHLRERLRGQLRPTEREG
jgi:RNA polymerase sigma-70 factor (ECF subfamily)